MEEPQLSLRPCSIPHSAPVAWLRADPQQQLEQPDPESLRAAIELVLANPKAVAEIIGRADSRSRACQCEHSRTFANFCASPSPPREG